MSCCGQFHIGRRRPAGEDHVDTLLETIKDDDWDKLEPYLTTYRWKSDMLLPCMNLIIKKQHWISVRLLIKHGCRVTCEVLDAILTAVSKSGRQEDVFTVICDLVSTKILRRVANHSLFLAARDGLLEIVRYLIDKGCDVNAMYRIYQSQSLKGSSLHAAILSENLPVVDYLIRYADTDLNLMSGHGMTAVHLVICQCQHDVLDRLLGIKVDLREKITSSGATPLQVAVGLGCLTCVNILLAHHADVESTSLEFSGCYVCTPLMLAVMRQKHNIIKVLLAQVNCNINRKDSLSGMTALHRAADIGDLSIVELLLGHGAHPNPVDMDQATPLSLAVNECHVEVAETLLHHIGCDPDPGGQVVEMILERKLWSILVPLLCCCHPSVWFSRKKHLAALEAKNNLSINCHLKETMSLRYCCKLVIRRCLDNVCAERIQALGLPEKVAAYVSYSGI